MKKVIALLLTLSMAVMTLGPALSAGITTGLSRGSGGGQPPIIKAKWEMKTSTQGLDDFSASGAQFLAPGVWNTDMNYTVCAIATDPNGAADIDGVYADIYYPTGVAFHPEDPFHLDQINGGTVSVPDYGENGCGEFIEENTLIKLTKSNGIQLFCNDIKNNNNNLPEFFGGYDYAEICGPDGELEKEEAYVYCDDKTLTWEDPAGDYKVHVFAQDKAGNSSVVRENHFEYLPSTGFEVDFNEVEYGEVLLNTHKIISGDLTWDGANNDTSPASIRNLGNTRLYLWVEQDDMGLGQTSDQWNVLYDARVGNETADWRNYWPEQNKRLEDILDLSELEEIDFSILVTKWPDSQTVYGGDMYLTATAANFRQCWPD